MESIKQAILNYYKTRPSYVEMNFYDLQDIVGISTEDLNTFLKALLREGFICNPYAADNVIYSFRLNR